MTREQQLVKAIEAHRKSCNSSKNIAAWYDDRLWSVLDAEPEQERTCDGCRNDNSTSGHVDSVCQTCSRIEPLGRYDTDNWQPKPPAAEAVPLKMRTEAQQLTRYQCEWYENLPAERDRVMAEIKRQSAALERIAVALERK